MSKTTSSPRAQSSGKRALNVIIHCMGSAYGFADRAFFYIKYFIRKTVCLWFEVKRPKIRMFLYEMLYSSAKLLNPSSLTPSPFQTVIVETRFGKFKVRPKTVDMSNASPAFERDDIDYTLRLIRNLIRSGKDVLYLDIGADIGTFTVTVGNAFKDSNGFQIYSIEPSSSSFAVLAENISINCLNNTATALNIALWSVETQLMLDFNPSAPGSSGIAQSGETVTAKTLDSVVPEPSGWDAILMKMDVEGAEEEVLKGASKMITNAKEVYLMVEDFVEPKILDYLEGINAVFIAKKTPYNSWWKISND